MSAAEPQPRPTLVLLVENGREVVVERVDGRRPTMPLVESLLRLQLEARRRGGRIELRDVPAELHGLLELVGLARVLGLEPRGQPELLEQLGVDEVVQARDPPV
ncbi:MAG TPA: hypothetical protein VN238_09795 [Solirubrobacteraceae bacterium]|nr:hypothetical protein [Solirubrobacteraceae bacterium]